MIRLVTFGGQQSHVLVSFRFYSGWICAVLEGRGVGVFFVYLEL